ncbi:DUF58 domain-containing protein [Yonghaparkia sp. Root332]|uniref:DUF58 domain-containing protein n=1 Tax=Yonghaparkia sp. Root332 TaxID=1736516 RepID=UPI0006F8C2C0|nr:DUF58 domain-containing protein [Yonghaparkia sp. Root332]KQV24572.1 hypothetical protein ASC54_08540 [Yonghaparkia sp. Root332]
MRARRERASGGVPRLTGRGWGFLVVAANLFALAYGLQRPELVPGAVIAAAAPLLALVVVAAARPRVRVTRHLDPVVATEGEPVRVGVLVSGRARGAEWIERVPMRPGYAGPGQLLPVRTGRPRSLGYRYWPAHRGLVSVGPLLIEDRDPFALAVRVTDTIAVATQLVVPEVAPLSPGPVPDPSAESGPRTTRSRERAADDVVTREYRQGDALRRVHWRVSARQGELMVRQDEPQAGPRARVLLDSQRAGHPDLARPAAAAPSGSRTFEWSVRMTAAVAAHLAERGYAVDLQTPSARPTEAPRGDGPVGELLGELAVLPLADREPLPAVSAAPGSVPVVAIASSPDDATLRWMLAQRSAGALGVALLVRSASTAPDDPGALAVEAAFAAADWNVVTVPIGTPPDAAWLALIGQQPELTGAEALAARVAGAAGPGLAGQGLAGAGAARG